MAINDSLRFYLGVAGSEQLLARPDATFSPPIEMLANEGRTAGGTLWRYKIATKRHFLWRYAELAERDALVSGGGMGVLSLETLYIADSQMNFIWPRSSGPVTTVVRFAKDSWNAELVRQVGPEAWYRVSFELVEG